MSSVSKCTSWWSTRIQTRLGVFFAWYGRKVYAKPWLFLLVGLILSFICGSGIFFMKQENRSLYLWIPRDTIIWSQYTYILNQFGSYPSVMLLLLSLKDDTNDNILTPNNLDLSYSIYNASYHIKLNFTSNGKQTEYYYHDLCIRAYPSSPYCLSDYSNIFGLLFGLNPAMWQNQETINTLINADDSKIDAFAGGIVYSLDSITSASTLIIKYKLQGSTNLTEQQIAYEYMGSFQSYWNLHGNDEGLNVYYYTDRSFDDEVDQVIKGDLPIFMLALLCMLIYLMFTLGKFSCIKARTWLALSALMVMICSLIMGFGIAMYFGTEFNSLCALVPFILLGVGMDDMIILVDTYDETPKSEDNNDVRLSVAMSECGLTITLTSFCSIIAFLLGSLTDIPGISSFCIFAGCSFIGNYLLQFLMFVPLMIYDDHRIQRRGNFCCCCICQHDEELNNDVGNSKCSMEYLIMNGIVPMLSKRYCRFIIISVFLIVLALSIYVSPQINTETDLTKLVPDDSYVIEFLQEFYDKFGNSVVDEVGIIIKNQDFSQKQVRDNVSNLINAIESEKDAIGVVEQWLLPFENWVSANNQTLDDFNQQMFYQYLKEFTNDSINQRWDSEIIYDDIQNPTKIVTTRFYLSVFKSETKNSQYKEYVTWNQIMTDYLQEDGFIFNPNYCFAYLADAITSLTVQNMLLTAGGVLIVLLLLLDIRMVFFIVIIVAMIDVNLIGWMWLCKVSLDSISYSQLVMAVGLTVDYVIHITHAISTAAPDDQPYEIRLRTAMKDIGVSVCKGAFTTLLGALALIFSQSQAFRTFFYMFTGIIIVAITHGILLTPALLGELTFIYHGIYNSHENEGTVIGNKLEVSQNIDNDTSVENNNLSNLEDHVFDTQNNGNESDKETIQLLLLLDMD